jgi:hypothetical protein
MPCDGTCASAIKLGHVERDVKDREKELATAQAELKKLQGTPIHVPTVLAHARDGSCPGCKTALEQHNAGVITRALNEMEPKALLKVVTDRKLLPTEFRIEVP